MDDQHFCKVILVVASYWRQHPTPWRRRTLRVADTGDATPRRIGSFKAVARHRITTFFGNTYLVERIPPITVYLPEHHVGDEHKHLLDHTPPWHAY